MNNITIVGFGSAGYAAMISVKKQNPGATIRIIDPKEKDLMHPCGLPYSLEGIVKSDELTQDINLRRMNVEKVKAAVSSIDAQKRKIMVKGKSLEEELDYETLILCTGSRPLIPPIGGINCFYRKGLYTFTDISDLDRISSEIRGTTRAIVIGAGAIGLETAMALKKHLDVVRVIEMQEQVLPGILDRDLAEAVQELLVPQGINVILGRKAEEIKGGEKFEGILSNGESIEADLGILAAGFKANTDIAAAAGIECNDNGIVVDTALRTSSEHIFAAGDCISGWSVIDKTMLRAKLATSAYRQGTVAGLNASGMNMEYRGSAGTFVTRIGDIEVAGTGFTTERARTLGYEPVSGKIKAGILPEYFPRNPQITMKIICDARSGKIIGAQAIGTRGAAERVNIISLAIESNISLDEISRLEMAYCPAVSEVYDPLLRAVDFTIRRIKR